MAASCLPKTLTMLLLDPVVDVRGLDCPAKDGGMHRLFGILQQKKTLGIYGKTPFKTDAEIFIISCFILKKNPSTGTPVNIRLFPAKNLSELQYHYAQEMGENRASSLRLLICRVIIPW